jgi:hypothetical protein
LSFLTGLRSVAAGWLALGFQTWGELMTILDEESPDADLLQA